MHFWGVANDVFGPYPQSPHEATGLGHSWGCCGKGRFSKESHGFVSDGDGCDQVLISIDRLYLSPGIHL